MKKLSLPLPLCLAVACSAGFCLGCEDACLREGLTVYTNGCITTPPAPNYISQCLNGIWHDRQLCGEQSDEFRPWKCEPDPNGDIQKLYARFPGCQFIGCYKSGLRECECLETFTPEIVE